MFIRYLTSPEKTFSMNHSFSILQMETTPNQKDVCSIPFCNVMALASDLCLLSEESEEKEVAFVTVSLRLAAVASSKALYLVFFLVLFFASSTRSY